MNPNSHRLVRNTPEEEAEIAKQLAEGSDTHEGSEED